MSITWFQRAAPKADTAEIDKAMEKQQQAIDRLEKAFEGLTVELKPGGKQDGPDA